MWKTNCTRYISEHFYIYCKSGSTDDDDDDDDEETTPQKKTKKKTTKESSDGKEKEKKSKSKGVLCSLYFKYILVSIISITWFIYICFMKMSKKM